MSNAAVVYGVTFDLNSEAILDDVADKLMENGFFINPASNFCWLSDFNTVEATVQALQKALSSYSIGEVYDICLHEFVETSSCQEVTKAVMFGE